MWILGQIDSDLTIDIDCNSATGEEFPDGSETPHSKVRECAGCIDLFR